MPYITVGEENSAPIDLYYEDHGAGAPVVLIHGWPLTSASWEKQSMALMDAGYRVISYDRRGFGRSSRPMWGYEYDTLARDLDMLISALDLREATLVGFSMGTGEVTRYLARYGSARVRKAALLSCLPPFLLKTEDNPTGVDQSVFDQIMMSISRDRLAFLTTFMHDFYNYDVLHGSRVSDEVVQFGWNAAADSSPKAVADCVPAWLTDFRSDVPQIDVPTLLIHGDSDRVLPYESTAVPLSNMLQDCHLVTVEGGPHGNIWTHADQVNTELLDFLKS
ncbi:alpha/beta fold hydrolase [Rugosimonospora africana]|uniref:Arylesterase n=1 Tax=Rugosimonospora africana TaxID=556532 RepID=A0A8J3QNV2_9ACTN|nr:alpha/beta hydrolase [Rugosimonospora africana]GIH14625.1 arylesterase [Rugosimonospora africana]